jgi:ABC-2 type transport system permease protein
MIIAGKEFADYLLSVRFYVLLAMLGVVATIPLLYASGIIRDLAEDLSGARAIFLAMFTAAPQAFEFLRVDVFVGILAPLLGVAFAFDAVNGERSAGTLPRLLSQPIHRDDVINGKFAAGLAAISLVLIAVVAVISGIGMIRLGIVPAGNEVLRLVAWLGLSILYVGLWLAFGLLLSVLLRSAAAAALIGIGVWLFVAVPWFGQLLVGLVAGIVAPLPGAINQDYLQALQVQQLISRLLPSTLYQEASIVLLRPSETSVSTPATIGQLISSQEQIGSILSLDQSLLLVWPHVVALLALTVVCFAGAYVAFMRQEVRA